MSTYSLGPIKFDQTIPFAVGHPVVASVQLDLDGEYKEGMKISWSASSPAFEFLTAPESQTNVLGVAKVTFTSLTSATGDLIATVAVTPSINRREPCIFIGGSASSSSAIYQTGFFGVYMPGTLDSWIVPAGYDLQAADAALVNGSAPSLLDARLNVRRTASGSNRPEVIGKFEYVGTGWRFQLVGNSVSLARGDELSIDLEATGLTKLDLQIAI